MKRTVLLCAAMSLLPAACLHVPEGGPGEVGTPEAPKTAAEVITRHVTAIGGVEALRKIEHRTVEARVVFKGAGECPEGEEDCEQEDQTGSFLLQNTASGGLYRRMVVGDFIEERGFDGKTGWTLGNNGTLRVDTEQEAAISKEDAILHWYFDLEGRGVALSLLEPRKKEGVGMLDGVEWTLADGSKKQLWFDRRTGLLEEERVEEGEGESAQTQLIEYDDYRPVDGVLVAHNVLVTTRVGDQPPMVTEFVTQRVDHQPLDTQKFAIPTLPKPTPKTDAWLARVEAAEAATQSNPKDASAFVELARATFAAGQFEKAARAAKQTLALERNEPEALWILARVQVLRGELKDATKTLAQAEKAGVRPDVVARQTAWIAHRKRDYETLADVLDEAGSPVMAGRYRAFAGKPLQAQIEGNACTVQQPLLVSDPLVAVELQIGDEKVGAILDTGASDLILTQSLSQRLEVPMHARAPQEAQDQGGAMELGFGELPKLALGSLTLENVPVTMFADEAVASMAGEHADQIHAVIGMGPLSDFIVAVDPASASLKLVPNTARCRRDQEALREGPSVPFAWHETHYMYISGKMNGAEGLFLLNTGMRGADMTATQRAYGHAGIGAPALRSDRAPMVRVERLTLSDEVEREQLRSAYGFFETTQTSDGFRLDGMLGMGALGQKPFTIDFGQQRIYFPEG